jgi:hypothetical protein
MLKIHKVFFFFERIKYFETLHICVRNPLQSCVKNTDRKNLLKSHKVNIIPQNLLKSLRFFLLK